MQDSFPLWLCSAALTYCTFGHQSFLETQSKCPRFLRSVPVPAAAARVLHSSSPWGHGATGPWWDRRKIILQKKFVQNSLSLWEEQPSQHFSPQTRRREISWGQISVGGKSPQTNFVLRLQIFWVLLPHWPPSSTYHSFLNHFSLLSLLSLSEREFTEWIQCINESQGNNRQPGKVLGWKSESVHVPTHFCDRTKPGEHLSHYTCACSFLIHLCSVVIEEWDHNWNSFRVTVSPPCWVLQQNYFIQDFISSLSFGINRKKEEGAWKNMLAEMLWQKALVFVMASRRARASVTAQLVCCLSPHVVHGSRACFSPSTLQLFSESLSGLSSCITIISSLEEHFFICGPFRLKHRSSIIKIRDIPTILLKFFIQTQTWFCNLWKKFFCNFVISEGGKHYTNNSNMPCQINETCVHAWSGHTWRETEFHICLFFFPLLYYLWYQTFHHCIGALMKKQLKDLSLLLASFRSARNLSVSLINSPRNLQNFWL